MPLAGDKIDYRSTSIGQREPAYVALAELLEVTLVTADGKLAKAAIISRDEVIPVMNNIVVAPVTSTIREIPTCIPVGPDQGIDHDSVAAFDSLAAVPKSVLTVRLGDLGPSGRRQICSALDAVANC